MNGEEKLLSKEQKDKIVKKYHGFLDSLEKLLINSDILSSHEKYDIMTDFQNQMELKIDAETYVQERQLNMQ